MTELRVSGIDWKEQQITAMRAQKGVPSNPTLPSPYPPSPRASRCLCIMLALTLTLTLDLDLPPHLPTGRMVRERQRDRLRKEEGLRNAVCVPSAYLHALEEEATESDSPEIGPALGAGGDAEGIGGAGRPQVNLESDTVMADDGDARGSSPALDLSFGVRCPEAGSEGEAREARSEGGRATKSQTGNLDDETDEDSASSEGSEGVANTAPHAGPEGVASTAPHVGPGLGYGRDEAGRGGQTPGAGGFAPGTLSPPGGKFRPPKLKLLGNTFEDMADARSH